MKIQYNDPKDKKYFVIKKDELCEFVLSKKHTHWWQKYPVTRGKIPFVITVPRGVSVIKENAFFGLRAGYGDKIRVVISEGVREIQANAFANSEIAELVISDTVSKISPDAFRGAKIEHIEVDKANFVFKSYEGSLFDKNMYTIIRYGQGTKTEYEIPQSVCTIGKRAFENAKSLERVKIPDGVVNIGDGAFYASALKEISLPSGIKNIGQKAFAMCRALTRASIPHGILSINHKLFYGCERLESVDIPKTVASIGVQAFYACRNLSNIKIPDIVYEIGRGAFDGCTILKFFEIPKAVRQIEERSFASCDCFTDITIPNTVEKIGKEAFSSCKRLSEVKISKGVKEIDEYAFLGCNEQLSVVLVGREKTDVLPYNKKWSCLSKDGIIKKKIKNIIYY